MQEKWATETNPKINLPWIIKTNSCFFFLSANAAETNCVAIRLLGNTNTGLIRLFRRPRPGMTMTAEVQKRGINAALLFAPCPLIIWWQVVLVRRPWVICLPDRDACCLELFALVDPAERPSATAPGPPAGCQDARMPSGSAEEPPSDKNYTVAQTQLGWELTELASVLQRRRENNATPRPRVRG